MTGKLLEDTPAVLSLGKLCEDHAYSYEWVSGQKPRLTKQGKNILYKTVTVQLLENTPAVLSLDKLCKEHGYTKEWPGVREPRLTQNGSQTLCRTENFVPLGVPGLSSSSTTASSSTSPPQDLFIGLETANKRSNEGATGNCKERSCRKLQRRRYSRRPFARSSGMVGGLQREPRRLTKEGKTIISTTDNSYLLSFQGYPPILEAFRLLHRHCRICLQQVQHKSEVTY